MHLAINFNELEQHIHIVEEEIKTLTLLNDQLRFYYDFQLQNGIAVSADLQNDLKRVKRIVSRARFRKEWMRNLESDFRRVDGEINRKLEAMKNMIQSSLD